MFKQVLASSVFAASVLLSGAAMANTAMPYNRSDANVGDIYTHALNTFYAHGLHGVHDLTMRNGTVDAAAITPRGRRVRVMVQPYSDRIQRG